MPTDKPQKRSNRDNIPISVYKRLALKSCNICANPDCRCILSGEDGYNIGEAAHICAASPGGPRYDEHQTPEQRNSLDNIIMLCSNCHSMIDDPFTWMNYPVKVLRQWKKQHEEKCLEMRSKEFAKLNVKNLDIAAKEIIQHQKEKLDDNYTFGLKKLELKMDRHFFSQSSRFLVSNAVGNFSTIDKYVNERTSEDGKFTDQIRSGIKSVYYNAISNGFQNDELFTETISELLVGIKDIAQQSAIIALCVYYMEHCDLFSEE